MIELAVAAFVLWSVSLVVTPDKSTMRENITHRMLWSVLFALWGIMALLGAILLVLSQAG